MVAYSFKRRFVEPIRWGLGLGLDLSDDCVRIGSSKQQTIRAERFGRGRHARPGEDLQLYCRQRSPDGFLIGRARCIESLAIVLTLKPAGAGGHVAMGGLETAIGRERALHYSGSALDEFAARDGFENWEEMLGFWREEHGPLESFVGRIIFWRPH